MVRVHLRVRDERANPSPFRADILVPGARSRAVWSVDGCAELEAPPGATLRVSRGFDHDAVELAVGPASDQRLEAVLVRRFDARKWGWYGGDNHVHVVHDPSSDPSLDIAYGARLAQSEGLDYIQLAYQWEPTGAWPDAAELDLRCREASRPGVAVSWNVETPKSFIEEDDGGETGDLHCLGHGWTVGLRDISRGPGWFHSGPNYRVLQEVARQGGVAGVAHPTRSWTHKGNLVSNRNSELPFDMVAGGPYAAIDILNDGPAGFFADERVWYTLLNLGYRIAGTANSDACLDRGAGPGRLRTYVRVRGDFTWDKVVEAIRAGRVVASSGPFVRWSVAGLPPGSEFASDGRVRRAVMRVWSAPQPAERLTAVQLIRCGEVVRAWDLRNLGIRSWSGAFDLRADEFAWYTLRVLSNPVAAPETPPAVAVGGVIWFLPSGFRRPEPTPACVDLSAVDEAGRPVSGAAVAVIDAEREVARFATDADGRVRITAPATACLNVAAGFAPGERRIFTDCPEILEACIATDTAWASLHQPTTYHSMRRLLSGLRMRVTLRSMPSA
jgi:hypothetical protein